MGGGGYPMYERTADCWRGTLKWPWPKAFLVSQHQSSAEDLNLHLDAECGADGIEDEITGGFS
jgi:hypothetical protein